MEIYEKLINIQVKLKAPKSQYNDFGKYHYRNCEDILEAIKPICLENKAVLTVGDELVQIGERYYVKAIAKLIDVESGECIQNIAYARESVTKKGMDDSQVTGATSSYARKYALNGLLCIDDTKDADSEEYGKAQESPTKTKKAPKEEANESQVLLEHQRLVQMMEDRGIDFRNKLNPMILDKAKLNTQDINSLNVEQLQVLCAVYKAIINKFDSQQVGK